VTGILLFWVSGLAAVAGAVGAVAVRNLFHAALLLGLGLAGVAGLYLFLDAPYLACIQVVVYIGGILVLILFATLFSADVMGQVQRAPWWARGAGVVGALLAAAVAWRLGTVALQHGQQLAVEPGTAAAAPDALVPTGAGPALGDLLLGTWLIPFLAAGVLLTVVLVGAVATVRRFRRPPGTVEVRHG
jgi:NADH:ubiquinone oxidoreductase subunit 6 (subunit J)